MNHPYHALFWALLTLSIYAGARLLNGRIRRWWSSPLLVTWLLCGTAIIGMHATYREYLSGTRWLITLLGPATIAFAVPIYQNRALVKKHKWLLAIGAVSGSALAIVTSLLLALAFDFSPELRASLLPRSVTTPLAMVTAQNLKGIPELTAALTAITGLFGAAIGETLLGRLPVRTAFAKGALFGMGAHGAGVAKARELGREEGVVASLIMVLAGLLNVLAAAAAGQLM